MNVREITAILEDFAPLSYQESYDNAGLIVGNPNMEVSGVLLAIDAIEAVIDEAINQKLNLVIAHHPIVFMGMKKLNGKNYIERAVIKAIKNDIAIYAAHTNLDNVLLGVNQQLCRKLGLINCKILAPKNSQLKKLAVFVPETHLQPVRQAIFDAGAGHIGEYDQCSYSVSGEGTFRAGPNANPYVGQINKLHTQAERKLEVIFPNHLQAPIIQAMLQQHPYQEVAYDIYQLENKYTAIGSGMVGQLPATVEPNEFLKRMKTAFNLKMIRHTHICKSQIKKVALCGGAGSFLLDNAIAQQADIFITADFKYHQFFDADNKIIIADVGHFESEQFTIDLIFDILTKKIPTFAIRKTSINTNPINYL